jgi:hypothetical protein
MSTNNDCSFNVRRVRENSPQINLAITVNEDVSLNEMCEAFEGFLLALGFSFPDGAHLGFEYKDNNIPTEE